MVGKKQVLKELQKFNDDLDKHLPELNLDYLKNKEIFTRDEDFTQVVPLLANNLMDLKTEIALIRKNLTDSVEGMVLRVISNQQQAFSQQMDRMFTQMLVEMKGNFGSYVSEMAGNISSIKKDLNELKVENNKLAVKFEAFDTKMIELQSVIEDVKFIKSDIPRVVEENIVDVKNLNSSLLSDVETQLEKFDSKFESLQFEVENIKSKEDSIRTELVNNFSKKFLEVSNRNIELENSLNKVANNIGVISENIAKEPKIIVKEVPKVVEKEVKVVKVNNSSSKKLKKVNFGSENSVKKLISIEDRLKKLESLK